MVLVLMVSLKEGEVKRRMRARLLKKNEFIDLMKNHKPGYGPAKRLLQINHVHAAGNFGAEFIFSVPVVDRGRERRG